MKNQVRFIYLVVILVIFIILASLASFAKAEDSFISFDDSESEYNWDDFDDFFDDDSTDPEIPDLTDDYVDPFTAELYGLNDNSATFSGTQRVETSGLPTYIEWDTDEVKLIQRALNDWLVSKGGAEYQIDVDGIFGPKTSEAIKRVQYKAHLTMDGLLGSKTMKEIGIYGQLSETSYFYNVNLATVPPSDNSDYMLVVSLPDHKLYLYQWSFPTWVLVGTTSCTIGKDSTPTPSGKFSVVAKKADLSHKGYPNARLCTGIGDGIYFHTTLSKSESTGKSKSHGCIRLKEKYARWIYENIPEGTPVVIHDRPSDAK